MSRNLTEVIKMAAKKNLDGFIGGSLVSPEDHLRVMNKKRIEQRKAEQLAKKEEPKPEAE